LDPAGTLGGAREKGNDDEECRGEQEECGGCTESRRRAWIQEILNENDAGIDDMSAPAARIVNAVKRKADPQLVLMRSFSSEGSCGGLHISPEKQNDAERQSMADIPVAMAVSCGQC